MTHVPNVAGTLRVPSNRTRSVRTTLPGSPRLRRRVAHVAASLRDACLRVRHGGLAHVAWCRKRPLVRSRRRWSIFPLLLLLLVTASGCEETIQDAYGGRNGPYHARSVNGTTVLADLLDQAGHKVISRTALSPGLHESADCIFWFPDDFQSPSAAHRQWLENWLIQKPGRTLVYVGRDYDAEPHYWAKVIPGAPFAEAAEFSARQTRAQTDFNLDRSALVDGEDCDWYSIHKLATPKGVTTLTGPFSTGIDASQGEIELASRMKFQPQDEVLLASEAETLVARRYLSPYGTWGTADSSQLIIVTNGSFLLSLPLVNHEHRKLAAHLINELPAGQRVVFLESGPGGPDIRESDPVARTPNGLEVFSIWPLGAILVHLAVVGILFCFARLPIFGVPRAALRQSLSDFGKHVEAVGHLLRLTGDIKYARSKIDHWRHSARPEQSSTARRPRATKL